MSVVNLYELILNSYNQTAKRLSEVRKEIKDKLDNAISLSRVEVKGVIKTFDKIQKQVAELKVQLEDRFVRKFEAVLDILGVPSLRDLEELRARVEKLDKKIKELSKNNHKAPQ